MLTGDQWHAVEKIEEELTQTADLHDAFQKAMAVLLAALNRPAAALFLPRLCNHLDRDWTYLNVPLAWEEAISSGSSFLENIATQTALSGQYLPCSRDYSVAGVFPIALTQQVFGALVVNGPEIPPDEIPLWEAFLRPFARVANLHTKISGNANGPHAYLDLLHSRDTLRAMFDSLPISIYIINTANQVVAVNFSRASRAGEIPQKIVGQTCYESLFHRDSICPGCRIADTFNKRKTTRRVHRVRRRKDQFEEWEISTFPIFDDKNQVVQTIIIEQDITEKRSLEANLIQSEKLAAVGELAAGIAHEINNPLTAIIANAQLLKLEIPPEENDLLESVNMIEMAGTRASQVVRNLLGIARKEKYDFEPTDLNDSIRNALIFVHHEISGRPIKVVLDLAEHMPNVFASQDHLQGVWINLIMNAIDAIDKETGVVSITSSYTDDAFKVTVTDNGKGIDQDHLGHVFDPFFTTKAAGKGTGLGLSVCLRTIRHYGGTVDVDSQVGEWTRFTVNLPGTH